jgi:hypothetical protein
VSGFTVASGGILFKSLLGFFELHFVIVISHETINRCSEISWSSLPLQRSLLHSLLLQFQIAFAGNS